MIKCNCSLSAQAGQSMAEFLVMLGLFIVPFFYGMTYMSKVGEASAKTHNAARYSAWERTVFHPSGGGYNNKSNDDIAVEANNRIFRVSTEPLDSSQDRVLVDYNSMELDSMSQLYEKDYYDLPIYGERTFGNNNGGSNNSPQAVVTVAMSRGDHPGSVTSRVNQLGRLLNLDSDNFYTASAQTPLVKSQYLRPLDATQASSYDAMLVRPVSVNAIYTGSWNARGPSEVVDRVEGVLPSSLLSFLNPINNIAGMLGFEDFANDALIFGKVDPDRVPCQRLTTNANRSNC